MNVPQADLDNWRAFLERLRVTMEQASILARAGRIEEVKELLEFTRTVAVRMGHRLEQAGANRVSSLPAPPEVSLAFMDTPANRRFARALKEAAEAGMDVDKERGWYPDGPSEYLADWAQRVEQELFGPTGKGEGPEPG